MKVYMTLVMRMGWSSKLCLPTL